ncbi:protein kinase domain-containing protein [Hyalangium sp.]|uniref:protein kinase domain-containing protein n=1 Tax=Hyalangium sp. TaxID=2028555 RepID=UPI002D498904|nr:protein kinase [Hyalangium sp.]HYH97011.1 protein kinase [Hyalangium sp.]
MSPTNLRPDASSPEQWWAAPETSPDGHAAAAPKAPTPAAEAKDPLIGLVVGSFRLVRKLGGGGMGTVYLGEHTLIGSKVAVKFLHEHFASNEALVQRFLAEARAVNLIGHENIINIFDMSVLPPRRHYLVMEYLEGSPLSSLTGSAQPPSVIVPILTQVCDALQAAHLNGVVHRDLKPENIFLVRHDRTPHFVKVLDFGIAKLLDGGRTPGQTSMGTIIGTPEYMAPEQWAGKGVDGRTDLYALGIIAYELLTGRTPFGKGGLGSLLHAHLQEMPTAPHELNPSVPVPLSQIVMRAMAKRAEDRFGTSAEMRTALEQALTGQASASPPSLAAPSPPAPPSLPADTAMGIPPTAPAPPRRPASPPPLEVTARVVLVPGLEPARMACTDLSRAGAFLCTEGALPPLRSRVALTLELRDRHLPCIGEVVRHVTPAQASSWGMRAGFAVQFVDLSAVARDALARVAQGQHPPLAAPKVVLDDPQADALLTMLAQRMNSDPYVLLSLPQDATFDDVRQHARAAISALETISARPLSTRQARELAEMRLRVEKASDLLGHPRQRIEHDAWRSNFAGVARCISSGLTATEIESLRARYLLAHPGTEARERIHATTAAAWESQGSINLALTEYEKALSADPLNLQLQQRYWTLKQRGVKPTPPPDNGPKGHDVPGLRRRRS